MTTPSGLPEVTYTLHYRNPDRLRTMSKEGFATRDEAEEYYRLHMKPWGFVLKDVVLVEAP
jgi:hypothetical protein